MIAEQAAEWHVAHSEGGLGSQQSREFMRWLRTSPVHVAEYLTMVGVARDLAEAAHDSTTPLQALLSDEDASIRPFQVDTYDDPKLDETLPSKASGARVSRTTRTGRAPGRSVGRWVAAIATLVVVSMLLFACWNLFAPKASVETFATHHGEKRSLELPDNTLVQLDSDSAITVHFDRSGRHVVVDRGQAYFKIASDPGRPFSVRAGGSLIRDIGTAFDVYRRSSSTTIAVQDGRVQVWNIPRQPATKTGGWLSWFERKGKPLGQPVADLGAGQQVRIANTGRVISLGAVDVQRALAWRQGRIAFDDEAIASVAAEFNRYNDVQISVADSRIGALPVSGMFDAHDVPTFIAFLRSLPNVSVEKRGQHIIVYASRQARRHQD